MGLVLNNLGRIAKHSVHPKPLAYRTRVRMDLLNLRGQGALTRVSATT